MYGELAPVKGIVNLPPQEALDRAEGFLAAQGYAIAQRTYTTVTAQRQAEGGADEQDPLTLTVAVAPQSDDGVRMTVRGNDQAGVQGRQAAWMEWSESLPKMPETQTAEAGEQDAEGTADVPLPPPPPQRAQETGELTFLRKWWPLMALLTVAVLYVIAPAGGGGGGNGAADNSGGGGNDGGGGKVAEKLEQEHKVGQQAQPQKKEPQPQQEEQQAQGEQQEQRDGGGQAPVQQKPSFGDGTYQVGTDIQPGTYRTREGSPNCYWERLRNFGGGINGILANGGTNAPAIVAIEPTDAGFNSQGCGTWTKLQ